MQYIQLSQGKHAIVDDADFEWLNQWKWCFDSGYAVRRLGVRKIKMHRLINQTPVGNDTDHINRNKLDNRRANLRTATRSENRFNSSLPSNASSGYKGVGIHSLTKKWRAQISVNGKRQHLGLFDTIDEAIKARRKAEQELGVLA